MGGHGGLNILPQKRWNVYNRDNRLKVAQDEAKARQEQQEIEQRHEQAEREFRYQQMLARARGEPAPEAAAKEQPHAQQVEASTAVAVEAPAAVQAAQEHINFWKDLEAKAQHPEVEAAKKQEQRQRGKTEMQTSDAKFDERFQLGYNMKGNVPWYARAPAAAAAAAVEQQGQQQGACKQLRGRAEQPEAVAAVEDGSKRPRLSAPEGGAGTGSDGAVAVQQQALGRKALKVQLLAELRQLDAVLGQAASLGRNATAPSGSSSGSDGGSSSSSSSSGSSDSENKSDDLRKGKSRHMSRSLKQRSRSSRHKWKKRQRSDCSDSSPERHRSKSSSRDRRQERKQRAGSSKDKHGSKKGRAGLSIEQLRQQRLQREQQERERGRLVLVGAFKADGEGSGPPNGSKYYSGYGNVPPSKHQRR